jgi:hypothetical protein
MTWRWTHKNVVSLVLSGGATGSPPKLHLNYFSPAYIEEEALNRSVSPSPK